MFDPPVEAWYVWLGVGIVSVAATGLALSFPTAPAPSATPVADGIDSVASSPHDARTTVKVPAAKFRLQPKSLALRSDGGTAHAQLAFGPVTPVGDGKLRRVLDGERPRDVFSNQSAFETAIGTAQNRTGSWQEAPDRLTVARVSWGDVDATLVG
ncbi:DUF7283 family protein [Salinibaculum rarum]|uniref:DUF7283 family protein n=1 Tax=Salinibaculum rarum TaxID=3058903 RepID=UPI00265DFE47|nr:hypothetical protein [Salinibaculum sp. KK48]